MTEAQIVLACHNASFGRAMARALQGHEAFKLAGVLAIHRPPSRKKMLWRRILRLMWSSKSERAVERVEQDLARKADQVLTQQANPPKDWPRDVPVRLSANPNSDDVVAWLQDLCPDLIVVTGGPILRKPVFGLPRLGTLNMHSSLLPHYRGTQAEFWQVLDERWDTCGITIHYIDDGVDTGRILMQRKTEITPPISPQMLRVQNLLSALDLVPEAIARVVRGGAQTRPQGKGEPAKRSSDRTLERRRALLRKLGYVSGT